MNPSDLDGCKSDDVEGLTDDALHEGGDLVTYTIAAPREPVA
jgi:hypothetical protein